MATDSRRRRTRPPAALEVAEPEIPELRKKEEEKKRSGVPWLPGGSGSAELIVGGGRAVSAGGGAWGFLGSARLAGGLARLFGRTWLGAFFATSAGRGLVALGLAGWAALMGVAGYSLLTGGAGKGGLSAGFLRLGPIDPSGISIKRPRNRSLDYLARSNQGEILFDPENPMAPRAEESPAADAAKDAAAPEAPELPKAPELPAEGAGAGAGAGAAGGLREGFIRKLTENTGGLFGGGSGAKLNNSGGIAGQFNLKASRLPKLTPRKKLSPLARLKKSYGVTRMNTRKGYSSRAMGQLKLARNMSATGAATAADTGARQYATNAFEQTATRGGEMSPIGSSSGGPNPIVVPPGTGAPPELPPTPVIPPGTNVTPYQPNLDAAKSMGQMAGMLKMLGMLLMVLGAAIIAIAIILQLNPFTSAIGAMMYAIGILLIAMGMMMMQQAASMAGMGKGLGQGISNGYGQQQQGQVVQECVDQAYQNNTNPDNCQPSTQVDQKRNTVHEDVEAERNADYRLEGGAEGGQ